MRWTRLATIVLVVVVVLVVAVSGAAVDDSDADKAIIEKIVKEKIVQEKEDAALKAEVDRLTDKVQSELKAKKAPADPVPPAPVDVPEPAADDATAVEVPAKKAILRKSVKKIAKNVVDVPDDVDLGMERSEIDGGVGQLQWSWGTVAFALSKKGAVRRSYDDGKTWEDLTERLLMSTTQVAGKMKFSDIYINKQNPSVVFLAGKGPYNFVTVDSGESFLFAGQVVLSAIQFHPSEPSWILAQSLSKGCAAPSAANPCFQRLLMTQTLGSDWTKLATYVEQADWNRGNLDDPERANRIYACIKRKRTGDQQYLTWDPNVDFFVSDDFFETRRILVKSGNRFLTGASNFMFVATASPDIENQVRLVVNNNNVTGDEEFIAANVPTLRQHSYTILDSSDGVVFLHVNHAGVDDSSGTVYVSDSTGIQYSMSLPNNRRDKSGTADFEKVSGLEGVYMANYIHQEDQAGAVVNQWRDKTRLEVRPRKKKDRTDDNNGGGMVRTVITFDKGGTWSYLQAPKTDVFGKEIKCDEDDDCFLHLHGIIDQYGPFYSAENAIGIIMATGSVGSQLQDGDIGMGTYLSRDAGLTWTEVARGSYTYEYGDHGSLIVMAKDTEPTNTVLYTWDQGLTWFRLVVSDTPISVDNIVIEPRGRSKSFVLHGAENEKGVLVHIDFAKLHNGRVCEIGTDYEYWSPADDRTDFGECLLGHQISYLRRKQEVPCQNEMEFEPAVLVGHCQCTARDFECDVGYAKLTVGEAECLPVDTGIPIIEDSCSTAGFHRITKGYRRITGDTCLYGEQWDATLVGCSSFPQKAGQFILGVLFVIAILAFAVTFLSKHNYMIDLIRRFKSRFSKSGYQSMQQSMDDSEFDNFGADDHNSAELFNDPDLADCEGDHDGALDYVLDSRIPAMPGLVARQGGPVPRLPGPPSKSNGHSIEG